MNILLEDAIAMLQSLDETVLFSVTFLKRTSKAPEWREMLCRLGVKKFLKGGVINYDWRAKNLLPVFDMGVFNSYVNGGLNPDVAGEKSYRSVNLEGLLKFKLHGIEYDVEPQEKKLFVRNGEHCSAYSAKDAERMTRLSGWVVDS